MITRPNGVRRTGGLGAVLWAAVLLLGCTHARQSDPRPAPEARAVTSENESEHRAPGVSLVTETGTPVKLSELHPKRSLVLFFMRGYAGAFACYYCSLQTRALKGQFDALRSAGADVAIVLPGTTDIRGYLKAVGTSDQEHSDPDFSVPFPVLSDPDFSACRAFEVPFDVSMQDFFPVSQPATFVISADGRIVYAHHGQDPSDRPDVETVLNVLSGREPVVAEPSLKEAPPAAPPFLWSTYAEGVAQARALRKPILLEFYADW